MAATEKQTFEQFKNLGLLISIVLILADFYFYHFNTLHHLGYTNIYVSKFIIQLKDMGIYQNAITSKLLILIITFLNIALDRGKKNIDIDKQTVIISAISASILFLSLSFLTFFNLNIILYILLFFCAYFYLIKTYSMVNRIFNTDIMKDRLNKKNKIFPQMIELLENDMSVNIPYKFVKSYKEIKGGYTPQYQKGYINLVAPQRATIILGKPGSGKSYSFNEEILRQHIMKAFSIANYDYKFPTLTNIAYNYYLTYRSSYDKYENKARFAVIHLDDPRYSDRCNPLHPDLLTRKAQAIDAIKTIFFNLDKKSISKPDFFQLSAQAITSATLWFLRIYKNGIYCSFPHVIEFLQHSDEKILKILDSYEELKYFTAAFSDALEKESFEQLSGQTASARIPLGQCATDEMFFTMTDPDNTGINLRINAKEHVTILNIANDPETQQTNSPALGLYMSTIAKLINKQDRVPCNFHVDELPTIYINGLNNLIATGRSNGICVTVSAQDYTQLVMNYGKDIADTIFNTIDNIICGKVAIDTAKKITETIGKINYQNQSVSVSENNSSTISTQRDYIVPYEDIAQLSQGEFVGVVSDSFDQPIELKAFRGLVSPSKKDLGKKAYPMKHPDLTQEDLKNNSKRIRDEIKQLIDDELDRLKGLKAQEMEQLQDQVIDGFDFSNDFQDSNTNTPDSNIVNDDSTSFEDDIINDTITENISDSSDSEALELNNYTPDQVFENSTVEFNTNESLDKDYNNPVLSINDDQTNYQEKEQIQNTIQEEQEEQEDPNAAFFKMLESIEPISKSE